MGNQYKLALKSTIKGPKGWTENRGIFIWSSKKEGSVKI